MKYITKQRVMSVAVLLAALAMLATGVATAAPSGEFTTTVTAQSIDITVTDGTIDFGTVVFGTCVRTGGSFTLSTTECGPALGTMVPGQTQVLTNLGAPAKVAIKLAPLALVPSMVWGADCGGTADTAEWTEGSTPGVDVFNFLVDSPLGVKEVIGGLLGTTIDDLMTTGEAVPLNFKLSMPTASGSFGPCTFKTTITASIP